MSDQALSHRASAAKPPASSATRPRSGSPPASLTSHLTLDVWAMIAAFAVFVVLVFAGVIPPAWQ